MFMAKANYLQLTFQGSLSGKGRLAHTPSIGSCLSTQLNGIYLTLTPGRKLGPSPPGKIFSSAGPRDS
uniref:Uncharacterized protein n=1 Tax=Picea sitchensis TaxID=3332 RepID=A0A6B9XSE7_PICSI|nr:hypothetical protein Q903MT_gene3925 [Picea sitchensis]